MTTMVDTVFQKALQLSEDSRMSLVERLIVSASAGTDIEHEQVKVAEGRLEDLRSGSVQGVLVEEAIQRVRESLKNFSPS